MTTVREKIRKLRALARDKGASKHEAALALAKAQVLESRTATAKATAHAIAQLLEARGLAVRVRRYSREEAENGWNSKAGDIAIRYRRRKSYSPHDLEILVTEYE